MYINQKDWSEWYRLNEIDSYKKKNQLLHGEMHPYYKKQKFRRVCVRL